MKLVHYIVGAVVTLLLSMFINFPFLHDNYWGKTLALWSLCLLVMVCMAIYLGRRSPAQGAQPRNWP